jgi:hypothetical protein
MTIGEQCAAAISLMLTGTALESDELDHRLEASGFTPNAVRYGRHLAKLVVDRVGFGPGAKYMVSLAPQSPLRADAG